MEAFTQATYTKILYTEPCFLFKQETDIDISFQVYRGMMHLKRSTTIEAKKSFFFFENPGDQKKVHQADRKSILSLIFRLYIKI